MRGGLVSGSRVTFVGDAMAAVIQGVAEVRDLIGETPVIVGGLAVLARLSNPYRATVDLDVVDRMLGATPQLEVLRSAPGAEPVVARVVPSGCVASMAVWVRDWGACSQVSPDWVPVRDRRLSQPGGIRGSSSQLRAAPRQLSP